MANSLQTFCGPILAAQKPGSLDQPADVYYLALKETTKNIPLTVILGEGCNSSFVHQDETP